MRERDPHHAVRAVLAKFREPDPNRKLLLVLGSALLATIFVPIATSPVVTFAFSSGQPKWTHLLWPCIAGGAYLFVAGAPAEMRQRVPPVVLRWIPFAVAFLGVFMMSRGGGEGDGFAGDSLYMLGYATLVFGLLARIANPEDPITRVIVGLGAGMLVPGWIEMIGALHFSGQPPLLLITSLLHFLVTFLGVGCLLLVVPADKLHPALRVVVAREPLVCAILILWLPTMVVLFGVVVLVHFDGGVDTILWLGRSLIYVCAFFGVLFMTSPVAYENAKAIFGNRMGSGAPPPGGHSP